MKIYLFEDRLIKHDNFLTALEVIQEIKGQYGLRDIPIEAGFKNS